MLLNCVHADKTGQDFLRDHTNAHIQIEAESLIHSGILTQAPLVKMNLHRIFNGFSLFSFMPAYLLQLLYVFYCFGL